ncbi:MAG: RHS repeat protein, partial [Burkholderiales bacterium]
AIAWDYGHAGGVASRETRYSGMLPGGYARQVETQAGLNDTNNPASLLAAVQGLSSHVVDDDRITEFDLDRLDRVTEKRLLSLVQDHVDASGKRTKSTAAAISRYEYDGLGHVTKQKELAAQLGNDQAWEISDTYYDNLGRETQRRGVAFTDWQSVSVRPVTDVEYNGLGDVVRRIVRGQDNGVETDDRITRYEYLANGVLTRTTDPSGAVMQYDYDDQGGLVRRSSLNVLRSDGTSRSLVHRYTLDAAGRVASATTSESDKPAQAETRKTLYNAFGEISAKGIGDGWEEFFEYSTAGKLVKTNTGDGAIKFYVYDTAGNQTREIKGNGDTSVNLKTMALEEATTNNKLFSRVSIYDKRNLITQTIDPQIEVLKNTVSMSALYGQAWVAANQISDPGLVPAAMLPNASVTIVPGTKPMLYLSNAGSGYAVVSTSINGVFWAEAGNTVGQPMAVDLSSLKGLGRYTLIYQTFTSGSGVWLGDNPPLTKGRIDITVAADGNVTYDLMAPLDQDRSPAYVKFPPDFGRPERWTDYNVQIVVDGVSFPFKTYNSYYNTNFPSYCWAAVEVGQFRPASGHKDIYLHYNIVGSLTKGTVRVRIDANGGLQKLENNADPTALPVRFSMLGRNIRQAVITGVNRRTGGRIQGVVPGVYIAANGTNPAGTTFVWDLKGYLAAGDEMDYTLEPVEANYTATLDEGGEALVQKGRIVMVNGVPSVLKQVITLNTGEKVTIKRFQDFNAFGEVKEERDERVGERMLAAINDDRAQKGQSALSALTAEQLAAARTTLKYNTLGQLVQKLDPETFVTAENGFRFRARPETNYGYDLLGRMTTMQDANGNLSRVQYLAGSRGADARVQREFDAAGGNADVFNVTGGGIRLNEYDVFCDSRRLTEAQGSSEARVTERAYDERGLLKTVIRKGVQRLANGNGETLD